MKNYIKLLLALLIILIIMKDSKNGHAESPYPPSTAISGITWDTSTLARKAPGSDNWAMTWAADGNIYASWGDGGGLGGTNDDGRVSLGVARIVGPPESFVGANVWGGKDAENPATFNGKSVGMLSVGGTLYKWRGPSSGFTAWENTYLAKSNDLGATWQLSSGTFFTYTDGFSKPTFLNFGMDYSGAKDDYVYIYAPDGSGGDGSPSINVSFARVHKSNIENRALYEFFKGLDGSGNPLWTNDVTQRVPVFTDAGGGISDSPSVVYNPGLNRYIMCKTHDPGIYPAHGGLGIFDSPNPWGPWTTVEYVDDWMGSKNMYFCNFPTKWISSDGRTLWMVFTGWGGDVIAQDAYQHMKGVLTMADTTPPTTPTSPNATAMSDAQINLTWTAASDPESSVNLYRIYRGGVAIGTSPTTSFSNTGLDEATLYTYEVSAINGAGLEGPKSLTASATTFSDTTGPSILSARADGTPTKVVLVFSEPVEEISASTVSNYGIDNGITITNAVLGSDLITVTLTTSTHTESISYLLTVNNIKDRSVGSNLIAPNSNANYTFVKDLLISNLSVVSGESYEVVKNGFTDGAFVFIDRTFTYSSVPSPLNGSTYIKTANGDKSSTGSAFLTFDVNHDVTIYIAHDDRITLKPAWLLSSYIDSGQDVLLDSKSHSLWKKDFSAGSITLGGNEGSGTNMYTVIVVTQGTGLPVDSLPPGVPTGLFVK